MSGKSLGAAFLLPADYAREDGVSHLQHRLELCPVEAGPLRGCKGCATHLCWAVVASQGWRRQGSRVLTRLRALLRTVLQGVAVCSLCSQAHCRQRSTKCGRAWAKSPHIHVFREKLGFGKGKGSEHPLHLHPAACRHGDGAGTGCGSWGQSSPRTTPGLLLLLLPRQRQYDLLKLFLFPSSSSSVVCVRKTNCLIIVLISNHVTFSVTLQSR